MNKTIAAIVPKIGEIRKGREISKRPPQNNFIWHACEDCGKERWVYSTKGMPITCLCQHCASKKNGFCMRGKHSCHWKGGRKVTNKGYIKIWVTPDDFFRPMADRHGYVFEHRLVVAKRLSRCLHLWEIVHHKNGVKDDNRDENLQLVQEIQHHQLTQLEDKIRKLEMKVEDQAKLIRLLQWQNINISKEIKL